jgi:hypothetical protein
MATAPCVVMIPEMLDPELLVLCEHDAEPDECPICGRDETESSFFDPHAWVEAYAATSREPPDVPVELAGVPFG